MCGWLRLSKNKYKPSGKWSCRHQVCPTNYWCNDLMTVLARQLSCHLPSSSSQVVRHYAKHDEESQRSRQTWEIRFALTVKYNNNTIYHHCACTGTGKCIPVSKKPSTTRLVKMVVGYFSHIHFNRKKKKILLYFRNYGKSPRHVIVHINMPKYDKHFHFVLSWVVGDNNLLSRVNLVNFNVN